MPTNSWRSIAADHPRLLRWLVYGLIAAVGAVLAYYKLFSQFAYYDDEGYVLTSLSEFLHGGTLYDEVFSQYGPLYHELFGGFFGLTGIDLVNNNGRLVVLVVWVLTAAALGLTAERLTGRLSLGVITMLAALGLLADALGEEPMHPIGLTTALMVAVFACAAWPARRSVARGAIALGAVCGALAMIKINLGALAVAGLVMAALLTFGAATRWARWAALALAVATPTALLASNLSLDWVQDLLLLVAGALVAVVLRAWPAPGDDGDGFWRWVLRFAAAFAAVSAVSLLIILALGSSPSGVVHALIIDPPRQASILLVTPPLPPTTAAWAIVAVALAFACRQLQGVFDGEQLLAARFLARIGVAVVIWLQILGAAPLSIGPSSGPVALAMLLTWLAAAPPRELEENRLERFARLAITLVAVLQVLQAYPVAVSQLAAASVPFALVAAIVMSDGLRLGTMWAERARDTDRRALATAGAAIVVTVGALVALNAVLRPLEEHRSNYRAHVALKLPGATRIHVPRQQAEALEKMNAALADCDAIVGYPGANSFYIWTGKRPPTGQNATSWFELFDAEREQEVVDAIKDKPGFCLIRNDKAISFAVNLSRSQKLPTGPLVNYLQTTPLQERLRVDTSAIAPTLVLFTRPGAAEN